ncbi:hypothetical protein [Pseudomonas sp. TMW22091]|uniref:hypothetical protein n=1 Tax=Pseudomonas sp. TMW22091 TaxID=2506435 RepID=UPI001F0D6843|nr:hypothetical protein [Pseudomonas sp. TMW22091]MCH4872978.1 hypothetical protein [Pseudomonas sp. TMW22091]
MAKRLSTFESELPELEKGFEEIKSLFRTGAVPKESDYASMIEYVHYLHKLLGIEGADSDHTPQLGSGLTTNADGVLSVLGYESRSAAEKVDAWISNIAYRLRATHMAISDECAVFFAYEAGDEGPATVATGFARQANSFPARSGTPTGFTLDGVDALWPADGNEYEGFFSGGTFTLAYKSLLAVGQVYNLKIKSAPLALPLTRTLDVVRIV